MRLAAVAALLLTSFGYVSNHAAAAVAAGAKTEKSRAGSSRLGSTPQFGTASWHAPSRASSQSRTASGRRWAAEEMVAAHRTLPLGSRVLVTNTRSDQQCVVQVVDRGPYVGGRIIDLSKAAARELGFINSGTGQVRVEALPTEVASEGALTNASTALAAASFKVTAGVLPATNSSEELL